MHDPIAFYQEIFAEFGAVNARRMFGGLGIYHAGTMFAIVFDDVLYLKSDAAGAQDFLARGLQRFTYTKGGRNIPLSYYQAPDEIMDDPREAAAWARKAHAAALAADSARRQKRPRSSPQRRGAASARRRTPS